MARESVWEVGSDFHWSGPAKGPFLPWPKLHEMFPSGREALLAIWRTLATCDANVLYVPDYFCEEVVDWLEHHGVRICRYSDNPLMASPAWETLTVSPGDAVLAVDFFGIRDGSGWKQWKCDYPDVIIIEDHTHDPRSEWALRSSAHYAFASLRKIFPVPDGAIAWSPCGMPLPSVAVGNDWAASSLKLAAMILKKDYLAGRGGTPAKELFRELQCRGESLLGNDATASIAPWSKLLLADGYPIVWRELRKANCAAFLDYISSAPHIRPLFSSWPAEACPFNAVVLFPSGEDRERCRCRLIAAGVYPCVHWRVDPDAPQHLLDLSERIMTIPADHRYNTKDMEAIASILLKEN